MRTKQPLAMRFAATIVAVCILASSVSVGAQTQTRPPLTNDDVIQMVKANLSESLILSQIGDSQTSFDLSTPELIRLSTSGVSDVLIAAMRKPSVPAATTRPPQRGVAPVVQPPGAAVAAPVAQAPRTAAGASPTPQESAVIGAGTAAEGRRDAEELANTLGTGGKVAGGAVVGFFTSLIGTSIGYFIVGPQALSAEAALLQQGHTPEYQLGFKTGWAEKTKSKKRKAFLIGGLLGTAASISLIVRAVNANTQECGYIGTTYTCY